MLFHKLYYNLKPLIPRWLQIQIRRQVVLRKRESYEHVWPIDERAGKPPEGWTGWPEGKKFALVLTHDVESAKGVPRCLPLAKLEERLGFRSSFNFVGEDYLTPPDLFDNLRGRGFEIGLHGLAHNGNLFKSEKFFRKKVERINRYLKEWGASGFRSPSMYRNLEWIGDLNIEYDASAFDTDPFEPQPDGVGTIFPFWVPATRNVQLKTRNPSNPSNSTNPSNPSNSSGFVELPYTLPQDFNLFVIMKEKGIDIWKRKLDWIADRGGMALVIIHPDYINLNNDKCRYDEYPVKFYEEILKYIKEKYQGHYWHPPPKEIAQFWARNYREGNRRIMSKKRVCMVAYSFYETDNRIRRYAESLVKAGKDVDAIVLRGSGQGDRDVLNGVTIYRIQRRESKEKGKLSYLSRLLIFFFKSTLVLTKKHLKQPYDLIHIHSVPDFEVFAAGLAKLFGSKVILDIHDLVPEFYISKFGSHKESPLFKALVFVEKLSGRFADHLIISNHIWENTLVKRSVEGPKCTAILNYPDPSIFYRRPRTRNDGKIVLIYPGTLAWHQGLDVAIKAFSFIKEQVPDAEFHIHGKGTEMNNLLKLIQDLRLQDKVFLKNILPLEEIACVMANADLGIVPKRNDVFGGEAFSTKILEFMALGIPVIVSETKIDRYYFNDNVVTFFRPGDEKDLAESMLKMIKDQDLRKNLAENALKFVEDFSWEKRKHEYLDLVDSLISPKIGKS